MNGGSHWTWTWNFIVCIVGIPALAFFIRWYMKNNEDQIKEIWKWIQNRPTDILTFKDHAEFCDRKQKAILDQIEKQHKELKEDFFRELNRLNGKK